MGQGNRNFRAGLAASKYWRCGKFTDIDDDSAMRINFVPPKKIEKKSIWLLTFFQNNYTSIQTVVKQAKQRILRLH